MVACTTTIASVKSWPTASLMVRRGVRNRRSRYTWFLRARADRPGGSELFGFCGDAGAGVRLLNAIPPLVRTRARHVLHVLDHSAIYPLIAGTYPPFALVSLRGPVGWILFSIVWTLAIAGIVFKSFAWPFCGGIRDCLPLSGLGCDLRGAPSDPCDQPAGSDLARSGRLGLHLRDRLLCP